MGRSCPGKENTQAAAGGSRGRTREGAAKSGATRVNKEAGTWHDKRLAGRKSRRQEGWERQMCGLVGRKGRRKERLRERCVGGKQESREASKKEDKQEGAREGGKDILQSCKTGSRTTAIAGESRVSAEQVDRHCKANRKIKGHSGREAVKHASFQEDMKVYARWQNKQQKRQADGK